MMSGTKGKPVFRKSNFYFKIGPHTGIAAESDPEKHRIIRKWMAPAFAPRALKEQDPVLHRVIDNAIDKMATKGDTPEGFDMTAVSCSFLSNSKLCQRTATDRRDLTVVRLDRLRPSRKPGLRVGLQEYRE
jgi:cytochrome P450